MSRLLFLASFFFILTVNYSAGKTGIVTGLQIPRYASLKADTVKLRVGPGKKYQTSYLYRCKNYPVKIIAEFDNWRKIEDVEKTQGWVHKSLLSGVSYAIIQSNKLLNRKSLAYKIANNQSLIFKAPDENSIPVAKLEFGVIVKIAKCESEWCKVNVQKITGWVRKANLWGVNEN